MTRMLKVTLFLMLSSFFSISHAAVMSHNSIQWDDSTSFVSDTSTGADWFRWNTKDIIGRTEWFRLFPGGGYSMTANHILDKVNQGVTVGNEWRFATQNDINGLLEGYFGTVSSNNVDAVDAGKFLEIFGESGSWPSIFLEDASDDRLTRVASVASYPHLSNHRVSTSEYFYNPRLDDSFFNQGSQYHLALVRGNSSSTGPVSVSEPVSLSLLLIGLCGLLYSRKRIV